MPKNYGTTGAVIQVDKDGNPAGPSRYWHQRCERCAQRGNPPGSMMGSPSTRCCQCGAGTAPPVLKVYPSDASDPTLRAWLAWQAALPEAGRHPDYAPIAAADGDPKAILAGT